LSSENNPTINHHNTRGRGRQKEGFNHDDYKHSFSQAAPLSSEDVGSVFRGAERNVSLVHGLAGLSRLQRLKRLRKIRGLTARQLMERSMSPRAHEAT